MEYSRMDRGPNRVPGRNPTPSSNGIPNMAISESMSSSDKTWGVRQKVGIPQNAKFAFPVIFTSFHDNYIEPLFLIRNKIGAKVMMIDTINSTPVIGLVTIPIKSYSCIISALRKEGSIIGPKTSPNTMGAIA